MTGATLSTPDDDLALICEAVRGGGRLALEYRARGLKVERKAGGSPVTDGDLAVDARLRDELLRARPGYGWLSEETPDDEASLGARLAAQRVFIVDPIDGTTALCEGQALVRTLRGGGGGRRSQGGRRVRPGAGRTLRRKLWGRRELQTVRRCRRAAPSG